MGIEEWLGVFAAVFIGGGSVAGFIYNAMLRKRVLEHGVPYDLRAKPLSKEEPLIVCVSGEGGAARLRDALITWGLGYMFPYLRIVGGHRVGRHSSSCEIMMYFGHKGTTYDYETQVQKDQYGKIAIAACYFPFSARETAKALILHEFLHALGMRHVNVPGHIMSHETVKDIVSVDPSALSGVMEAFYNLTQEGERE